MAIINGTSGDDILNGGAENDEIRGFEGQDSLFGGAGNDYLDGGTGADTMAGGVGNDDYVVDNVLDSVVEAVGEGSDRVFSSVDYTLSGDVEDLTLLAGSAAVTGTGNALGNVIVGNQNNNILSGGDGFDFLDGGAGADTMTGGLGSDNFFVDSLLDTVIEAAGEGFDTINSTIDYTVVASNTERLVLLAGSAAVSGTGDAQNNEIVGNQNNNILNGLAGNDKLDGGAGNDTIMGGAGEDILDGQDDDDNVQGGDAHDVMEGGDGNDVLDGGADEDILIGEAGADTLIGGAGYDTYTYFDPGFGIDTIQDTAAVAGEGNRILFATAAVEGPLTYTEDIVARTLTIQVGSSGTDKIILTNFDRTGVNGSLVIQQVQFSDGSIVNLLDLLNAPPPGTPTEGDDILTGTPFADTINALGGNDVINTLGGNDVVDGGTGNDVIDGGAGADTMLGGLGDDTFVVDQAGDVVTEQANEGTDLVQSSVNYTLGADVENLTLTGLAVNGTGNSLNNILTGNSAANLLSGGVGADTMLGGAGDDTYVVDDAGDVVTEQANAGIDTVQSSLDYILGANVENLTLTGLAVNGTGNSLNNVLTGNSAANVLTGGTGNDTYVVGTGDTAVEAANAGTDLVQSDVTFTLGANIENLTLTGIGAVNGTGNSLNNVLTGNSAANVLTGGAGADTMLGGAGDDIYVVDNAGDVVTEQVNEGIDTVQSSVDYILGANVENLALTGSAVNGTGNSLNNVLTDVSGVANVLTGGAGDDTYVVGTDDTAVETANEGTDLVLSRVDYTLGANLENLTLTSGFADNGAGNELNNTLIGNSAANVLTGGAGDDTMFGGAGNDTYVVDQAGDVVTEQANEGIDTVQSSVSFTLGANVEDLTLTGTDAIDGIGNELNNTLTGNSAANVLTGGAGSDTMLGGAGNDTYVVGAGDTVVEAANEGIDLVQSSVSVTLGANVEKLTLTGTDNIDGTGNSLNNTLIGNSAANVLTGGAGHDIYNVGTGDTVVEAVSEGTDLVLSNVSWTLGANTEKLTLLGTGTIDGTGNELNNTLIGNSAANVLTGGAGHDIYNVGTGDTVVEAATEGTDLVLSNVSWTLGAHTEKLTLLGTGTIDGTGNELNNTLIGNSAANVLTGGAGHDIYNVGTGDTVVEAANEGTDLVLSNVTWTLGAHTEKLTLLGTGTIDGTGNELNNTLIGNSAANVLTGGAGHDIYNVGTGDTVVEAANEGTDLVLSNVTWTLGAHTEKLTLLGTGTTDGTGNELNNTLIGNSAANVLTGGAGNDILSGRLGNDTYQVDRGEGQDTIVENDGTGGNSDLLLYGATINPLDLVLSQQANHLRIAIHGSTDRVTIQNWFSAPGTAQVETIQAGNGQTLLSTQVDQLIQAMATFSQQTGLTWDQAIDQQPQNVQTVLAASWQ